MLLRRKNSTNVLSIQFGNANHITFQADLCPKELALAAEHDLVGDDPKALLPKCQSLNPKAEYCIPIINVADQVSFNFNLKAYHK